MNVFVADGLVCIVSGVFYILVPDFQKYGWRKNDPDAVRRITSDSYKRSGRRLGVFLLILGCLILLGYLIFRR